MKKLAFYPLILLASTILISCKKDNGIPIGTFSANIQGTKTTFQVLAKASVLPVQGGFGIKISGFKKEPTTSGTSLSVIVVRSTSITPGTYIENNVGNPLVAMDYSSDFFFGVTRYSNYQSSINPLTIHITDISATSVKGTFQGELEGNFGGSISKTQVTNGVFNLSF